MESHTTLRDDEKEPETDVWAVMDHPGEHPQTGHRVSMSCRHVLCTSKTNYLMRKVAIKRPYNHRRKKHPQTFEQQVSEGVIWPNLVPDPAADNYETVPDANSTVLPELRIRTQVRLVISWLPARWMAT